MGVIKCGSYFNSAKLTHISNDVRLDADQVRVVMAGMHAAQHRRSFCHPPENASGIPYSYSWDGQSRWDSQNQGDPARRSQDKILRPVQYSDRLTSSRIAFGSFHRATPPLITLLPARTYACEIRQGKCTGQTGKSKTKKLCFKALSEPCPCRPQSVIVNCNIGGTCAALSSGLSR